MPDFFGKRGNPTPISNTYDTNILLQLSGYNYARGKYMSQGFLLLKGSFIAKEYRGQGNPGIIKIKNELLGKGLLMEESQNYYELKEDILLSSASTASRLCRGDDSDGLVTWTNSIQQTLKILLSE